jgi:nicotinamide riboside transporter PnuC
MKMFGSYKAKCLNSIEILEVSIKVSRKFTLPFTPYPLFQWSLQSKEILLNLSMKCWKSACNAQGSRVIIVVVQVGAVKIYVAALEALMKKAKRGWNPV